MPSSLSIALCYNTGSEVWVALSTSYEVTMNATYGMVGNNKMTHSCCCRNTTYLYMQQHGLDRTRLLIFCCREKPMWRRKIEWVPVDWECVSWFAQQLLFFCQRIHYVVYSAVILWASVCASSSSSLSHCCCLWMKSTPLDSSVRIKRLSLSLSCHFPFLQFGRKAIRHAAWYHRPSVVNRLVSCGATVDTGDSEGKSPLWWAACGGSMDCVDILLRAGASPNHGRCLLERVPFNQQYCYNRAMILQQLGGITNGHREEERSQGNFQKVRGCCKG